MSPNHAGGHDSREQQMRALERANQVKQARARLKAAIASGQVFPASVLLNVPSGAERWPVADLLQCQRRWGPARARRLLARFHISEVKPVGKLTERQRRLLASELEGKR